MRHALKPFGIVMAAMFVLPTLSVHAAAGIQSLRGSAPYKQAEIVLVMQKHTAKGRSCGCSTVGQCYVRFHNDGDSECVPDGTAGHACQGICSFTEWEPLPQGGVVPLRRDQSSVGTGGTAVITKQR